jgi:hypothetical protein
MYTDRLASLAVAIVVGGGTLIATAGADASVENGPGLFAQTMNGLSLYAAVMDGVSRDVLPFDFGAVTVQDIQLPEAGGK